MTGEQPLEGAVFERKLESLALDERRVRCALGGDREHACALVEAGDVAGEVARE
jgi:hypothetical protein